MALSEWLVDKSALVHLAESEEAAEWAARTQRGLVRISTLTRLEVGFSARSATELRESMTKPPLASMPVEYLTPPIEDRAVAIQVALAERGHHRGPSIPDLLIAATAELAQLTVLHIDADYEVIADLTGQSVERLRIE